MIKTKKNPRGYWTKERCKEEALKHNTKNALQKNCRAAYNAIYRNGWQEEAYSHLDPYNAHPSGYWTKERCKEEALKYKYLIDFIKKERKVYNAAYRRGWLDEVISHLIRTKKPPRYWHEKENCTKEALKYTHRTQFYKNNPSVYQLCREAGWLDEICKHMVSPYKPHGYWTKERCKEEALKYKTRGSLSTNSNSAYGAAFRNGWLDEIFEDINKSDEKQG